MATPQQAPGDAREDHAAASGAAIGVIYAGIETALIAAAAHVIRRAALSNVGRVVAARRLAQQAAAIFAERRDQIRQAITEAMSAAEREARAAVPPPVPGMPRIIPPAIATRVYTEPLAQSLDVAADRAIRDLQDTLGEALEPSEPPFPPLVRLGGADGGDRHRKAVRDAIDATRGGMPQTSLSLSRIQAAQKALDDLASQGVTGFVDRRGREWDLASYVEMATRTSVSNAWDDLQARALVRSGLDLIETYTHSTEGSCPHCLPWLGRILSLTGATPGYPTLAEAKADGFRHPNCRCSWAAKGQIIDVTNPVPAAQSADAYDASQRQRALERKVRVAGRMAQAAITPAARGKANARIKAARAASAAHRKQHGVVMTKVGAQRREHPTNAH